MTRFIEGWIAGKKIPDNIWLGTSVENQDQYPRIVNLLKTPAAKRFLSCEPLLGELDLKWPESVWPGGPPRCCGGQDCGCRGMPTEPPLIHGIDWVIVGMESGKSRRATPVESLISVAEQCREWNVPCYVKQDCAEKSGQQGRIPDEIWKIKEFPR